MWIKKNFTIKGKRIKLLEDNIIEDFVTSVETNLLKIK